MPTPPAMPAFAHDQARHLLSRAGFGGLPTEIDAAVKAGLPATVDGLLAGSGRALVQPDWLAEYRASVPGPKELRALSEMERNEVLAAGRAMGRDLVTSWLEWMAAATTPAEMLRQRMAFFWHGHFACTLQKIKSPGYAFDQLKLFNDQALGSYADLLHAIIRDPAMLIYLDNVQNRKANPNENLGRELMELFSLGQGHYTEADIREGARALTGLSIDRENGGFRFYPVLHDGGSKTIFGKTGAWDGDGFVDLILANDACAPYMVDRLWDCFAGVPLAPAVRTGLAGVMRANSYAIKPFLRALFTHPAFYGDDVVGAQIKSPLQLVIGTTRQTGLLPSTSAFYMSIMAGMGQVPYAPPNVKGWPGGRSWITTSRLLTRYTFAEVVATGAAPAGLNLGSDAGPGMRQAMRRNFSLDVDLEPLLLGVADRTDPGTVVDCLARTLLTVPPTAADRSSLIASVGSGPLTAASTRRLLGNLMLLPQYQLA